MATIRKKRLGVQLVYGRKAIERAPLYQANKIRRSSGDREC
jgi:hypothetical protein